jgi:hypothetical protein
MTCPDRPAPPPAEECTGPVTGFYVPGLAAYQVGPAALLHCQRCGEVMVFRAGPAIGFLATAHHRARVTPDPRWADR